MTRNMQLLNVTAAKSCAAWSNDAGCTVPVGHRHCTMSVACSLARVLRCESITKGSQRAAPRAHILAARLLTGSGGCIPQDFFRKSITPEYTDIQRVDRDRVRGIVEFATREDLKRAIRDLDGATPDSLYRSREGGRPSHVPAPNSEGRYKRGKEL